MNRNSILTLLAGIVIGAAGGWLAKPETQSSRNAEISSGKPGTKRSSRNDAPMLEKRRDATRWVERIGRDGVAVVAQEIPAGDIRSVMEKMMASMWGGMDDRQVKQLMFLMETWADQDPQGALAWARGLEVPRQREIALTGAAVAVGKDDPMAGFEIYTEVEAVNVSIGSERLSAMMRDVYRLAAAKGVDAVLDLAGRAPENKTRMLEAVSIDYPEGFDFAKLIDGLAKLSRMGNGAWISKSFVPSSPLGKWAVRDPDAAFDHAVSRSAEGQYVEVDSMGYEIRQKSGSLEEERWMGEKLASLDAGQLAALLPRSGLLNGPGQLRGYIRAMPEDAAAEFRFQAIKASAHVLEILQDVPDVEDRLATIERLRGVKETGYIRAMMRQWQVPEERIARVLDTVIQAE